jgi:stearoyl-CoA desaturase (delta-9 desaturase)
VSILIFPWLHCLESLQETYRFLFIRSVPLRVFLACVGAGSVQGSIQWWSSKHRAHHRWTDTVKDPYSVRKGIWYSHFMWMALNQNPKDKGRTDISDLNQDPIVVWQHKHYGKFILVFGMLFPMLVAGLGWGDWKGGLIYAGILRFFFLQQATFCVNSLAHWLGDQVSHYPCHPLFYILTTSQPFDDRNSPRDHVITALVTLGEGYHNFHHEVSNIPCQVVQLTTNARKVPFGLPQRHSMVAI